MLLIPAGAMSANTDGSLTFSFIFGLSWGLVAVSSNAARDALISNTLSPLLFLECSFHAPRAGPFPLIDTGVNDAPCGAGAAGVFDTPPYPANNGGRGGAGARRVGDGHSWTKCAAGGPKPGCASSSKSPRSIRSGTSTILSATRGDSPPTSSSDG